MIENKLQLHCILYICESFVLFYCTFRTLKNKNKIKYLINLIRNKTAV